MENEVKEPAPKYNYISPEEYLAMERASETKHEYYDGEVFAMSGASWAHNVIAKNITAVIPAFLKGKPCGMFGSDLRVHIPENGLYTYPDFSIICGKPELTDNERDTVVSPAVLIEILSETTKVYDRGKKFTLYKGIKTLQEYILIDSTAVSVEIFSRKQDDEWILTEFKKPSDSFTISTIQLILKLEDIYADVVIK